MEYVRLGETGLRVSRLALGCMSYGDPTTPGAHRWALADDGAQPFFRQAIELGITFWDTANVYQAGTSEEVVGRAIRRYSRREDIVLATKVHGRMHDGPGGSGLSRKAILEQIDASLTRLGTDYIDLYQIHRFDPETPVEETMEALHDIVKAGKVRYLGASSMYAWQFAKLQHAADLGGWTRFVSMQNQYNLLRRQDERELMAMCADTGVGLVPYSPQGKGRLARPWGEQATAPPSTRSSRRSTRRWTNRSSTPFRRSPRHAGSPWPRSPSPGCCATRGLRTDRRRHQAAPPARSRRRPRPEADRRRGRSTRSSVPTARAFVVLAKIGRASARAQGRSSERAELPECAEMSLERSRDMRHARPSPLTWRVTNLELLDGVPGSRVREDGRRRLHRIPSRGRRTCRYRMAVGLRGESRRRVGARMDRAWLEGLAEVGRVILHDWRGCGLSSRNVALPTSRRGLATCGQFLMPRDRRAR